MSLNDWKHSKVERCSDERRMNLGWSGKESLWTLHNILKRSKFDGKNLKW